MDACGFKSRRGYQTMIIFLILFIAGILVLTVWIADRNEKSERPLVINNNVVFCQFCCRGVGVAQWFCRDWTCAHCWEAYGLDERLHRTTHYLRRGGEMFTARLVKSQIRIEEIECDNTL